MTFDPSEHLMQMPGRRGGPPQDYLEVKWRLVWLADKYEAYAVKTEVLEHDQDKGYCLVRATVKTHDRASNKDLALLTPIREVVAHGSETAADFKDYIEKAETKAIGRALAILGLGTQFVGEELAEGVEPNGSPNVVDAPVSKSTTAKPAAQRGGKQPSKPASATTKPEAPPSEASTIKSTPTPTSEAANSRGNDLPGGMKEEAIREQIRTLAKKLGMTPADVVADVAATFNGKTPQQLTHRDLADYCQKLETRAEGK